MSATVIPVVNANFQSEWLAFGRMEWGRGAYSCYSRDERNPRYTWFFRVFQWGRWIDGGHAWVGGCQCAVKIQGKRMND